MSSRDEAIGVGIVELSLHRHENISVTETVLDAAHQAGHIHYADECPIDLPTYQRELLDQHDDKGTE